MQKLFCLSLMLLGGFLYAQTLQEKIQALIPKTTYQANEKFIQKIFANEQAFYQDRKLNIAKIIATLKSNGLLVLKLAKPANVSVTLRINTPQFVTDENPSLTFLAYAANNILSTIGYSYFYLTGAKKQQNQIFLTYTLNSESNIDPMVMIDSLVKRGYYIVDVHRDSPVHWTYDVGLISSTITHAKVPNKGTNHFTQINGKYWFTLNSSGVLQIAPLDKGVQWYPKIFLFDNNMNLIDSFVFNKPKSNHKIVVDNNVRHVFVSDSFNADILRNGIALDFKVN